MYVFILLGGFDNFYIEKKTKNLKLLLFLKLNNIRFAELTSIAKIIFYQHRVKFQLCQVLFVNLSFKFSKFIVKCRPRTMF